MLIMNKIQNSGLDPCMTDVKTLLQEENPISFRSALVHDDGYTVGFRLMPPCPATAVPEPRKYESDSAYLYRRRRSIFARMALVPRGVMQKQQFSLDCAFRKKQGFWGWVVSIESRLVSISLEQGIRVMAFAHPPDLRLLWGDSGHSVALYLDGQPWAFIHEEKNHGYSKGVLRPSIGAGNTWDQKLFEQTFIGK